ILGGVGILLFAEGEQAALQKDVGGWIVDFRQRLPSLAGAAEMLVRERLHQQGGRILHAGARGLFEQASGVVPAGLHGHFLVQLRRIAARLLRSSRAAGPSPLATAVTQATPYTACLPALTSDARRKFPSRRSRQPSLPAWRNLSAAISNRPAWNASR